MNTTAYGIDVATLFGGPVPGGGGWFLVHTYELPERAHRVLHKAALQRRRQNGADQLSALTVMYVSCQGLHSVAGCTELAH